MDLCAEVVSAVDVPHVSTVTRESFDLWRTGLLTLSFWHQSSSPRFSSVSTSDRTVIDWDDDRPRDGFW